MFNPGFFTCDDMKTNDPQRLGLRAYFIEPSTQVSTQDVAAQSRYVTANGVRPRPWHRRPSSSDRGAAWRGLKSAGEYNGEMSAWRRSKDQTLCFESSGDVRPGRDPWMDQSSLCRPGGAALFMCVRR